MTTPFLCDKYPGNVTITPEFCSRRHHKAKENPNDGGLDPCRTCEAGIKALKLFGHTKQPIRGIPSNKWRPRFKCPDCGEPVTAKTLCVKCKLDKESKEEEAIMASDSKQCGIEGCDNPLKAKGLCNKHYLQKITKERRLGTRKTGNGKSAIPQERSGSHKPGLVGSTSSPETKRPYKKKILAVMGEIIDTHPAHPPESRVERKNGNGKALLGQLLYASDLLDKQINQALEEGTIDTAMILDIRHRVGAVLKESLAKAQ